DQPNKFFEASRVRLNCPVLLELLILRWVGQAFALPDDGVGCLEKKVIHGTSDPTMSDKSKSQEHSQKPGKHGYGASVEYKKKPKIQSRSQKSQASVKSWSTKVNKTQNIPFSPSKFH
ncbi:hypothetical protein Tco_1437456, partial [Tanacetum coccineum]